MLWGDMDETTINSKQNSTLKRIRSALLGNEDGMLVLEGTRLVRDAVQSGLRLELLLVECRSQGDLGDLEAHADETRLVADGLLDNLGGLKHGPGVMALCREPREVRLGDIELGPTTRLLAIDGISDPGNLGALARAAEALGVTALLLVRGGVRPWSAKALRGSMGSLLRLPVATFETADILTRALTDRKVRQVVALTRGGEAPESYAWRGPLALWVSAEVGQSGSLAPGMDGVTIQMDGAVESLNVTVAASLLLQAARQGVSR